MLKDEPQQREEIFLAFESKKVVEAAPIPPFEGTRDSETHEEEGFVEEKTRRSSGDGSGRRFRNGQ